MRWIITETYSEPYQTSKMDCFSKIVTDFKPLTVFGKRSVLDVWQNSECSSDYVHPSALLRYLLCSQYITAWSVSKYRVFSGPYFPVSVQVQENADQKKLSIWDYFHVVIIVLLEILFNLTSSVFLSFGGENLISVFRNAINTSTFFVSKLFSFLPQNGNVLVLSINWLH